MSASSASDHEFFRLLWATCDNQVTADECAHLEQRVLDDPEACRAYVLFMSLHTDLLWQNQTSEAVASGEQRTAVSSQQPSANEETNRKSGTRKQKSASPILGFLGRTVSALNRAVVWSIVVVAAVFYGTFTVISWNLRPDELPRGLSPSPFAKSSQQMGSDPLASSVAVVSSTADVHWPKNVLSRSAEPSIRSGEPLRIESGIVQLELKSGVTLLVEGPAIWSVEGDNRAKLKWGKVIAKVPPQAIGFTLETPTAEVVDLGTEFGVHVNDKGETEVQMLLGSAHVKLAESPGKRQTTPRNPYKLAAGDAMRVRPADATTSAVGEFVKPRAEQIAAWKKLRQQVQSAPEPKLKLVSGGKPVTASSVFDADPNFPYKFPPSAITDGRLNDAPDSWWIAADKVLQSSLIVDLEAAYTIADIRLQNTHHGHWGDRATKDFRLSVSMNGQDFFPVREGTLDSVNGMDSPPLKRFPMRPVVRGRYVKFEALSFYGLGAGLNELRVFAVDEEGVGQDGNAPPPAN